MEPVTYEPVHVNKKSSRRRGGLLILAALLLGLALLGGWLVTPTLAQAVEFDLAISKSAVPSNFTVGSDNRYVISVFRTNNLPAGIPSISVEDQMPTGITIVSIIAEDWICNISADKRSLNCTYSKAIPIDLLSLPPIIVQVNIPANILPTVTNTAILNIDDGDPLNNESEPINTPIDSVDLEIKKSQTPQYALVGDTVIYTLEVINHGPADATVVKVDDKLSEYLTFVSSSDEVAYDAGSGIWDVGDMTDDVTETLTITAIINSSGNGKLIENIAVVSSTNASDYFATNNTAKTTLIVGGLEIEKTIDKPFPYTAYVGEPVTFLITVTNTSPEIKTNILFTDLFTDSLDVDIVKSNELTTDDLILYPTQNNPNSVNSTFRLDAYEDKLIKIVARPNNSITTPITITNSAKVNWSTLSTTSNEVELVVEPAAAILITKTDGITSILPGQFLTYTISVSNIGSRLMGEGIYIYDYLPSYLEDVTVIRGDLPNDIPITYNNSVIEIGPLNFPLNPDDEISFTIRAKVDENTPIGTTLVNTAEVITPENYFNANTDTTAVDNDTKVGTIVSSDMTISLSVNPTQAKVGENFTFRIIVQNTGTTQADNVTVTGAMHSVIDYVSSTPATGTTFSANTTARSYAWSIGSLAPNQSRTLSMVWKVNTSVTASNRYDHTATLTWDTTKSRTSNNVTYRVTPSSTLPGTGFGAAEQQDASGLSLAAMLFSALLGLLGAGSLIYGLWARGKKPLWANWFMLAGVILFCGGALFGVAAWGFQVIPSERPQQLAAINHATQAPQDIAPALLQPTDFVEVWDAWTTPTPESLPDYPIPAPPDHLNQGPDGNKADSSAMTRILIPVMGLDTVVKYVPFDSSTWLIGGLKQEVAWMGDTSWPGLGSNTGLAGHVDLANGDSGPFWNLGDLKAGDSVTVYTERSQYTYQVRESRIVPDSDLSVIEPSEKPQLTLITCTGWDAELRLYLLRLVVFADLIEVIPLNETALKP